jgi:hypothetical protein
MERRLSIERKISVGDLLTATTILISLVSVLFSWNADRKLRQTTEANDIRLAAANMQVDLYRWQQLALSIFAEAQPIYVEASETATSGAGDVPARLARARDLVWKRLNAQRTLIQRKIIDERIEGGYTRLFSYYPAARDLHLDTLTRLEHEEKEMFQKLLVTTERAVLDLHDHPTPLRTSDVGNALREKSAALEKEFESRLGSAASPADRYLVDKIRASNDTLLDRDATR